MDPELIAWLSEETDFAPAPRLEEMVPSDVSVLELKELSVEYQTLKFETSDALYVPAVVNETPVSVALAVVTASEDW